VLVLLGLVLVLVWCRCLSLPLEHLEENVEVVQSRC
jgi:hypothetical protein